jgi:exodeoxyribonuclease VII large subunit
MNHPGELVLSVSDFVAYLNETLELAYPYVTIEGELSNFRVSRNRWVYFDLKDEGSSVRFFGTVYTLPGPLEDGMVVRVSGSPRLHQQYGFSVNFVAVQPVGEGTIRKAAELLRTKLAAEGIFDPERKRRVPYPPRRIALITAGSSAAFADFIKILNARWRGIVVDHYDVLVQGEQAPAQIIAAIASANSQRDVPDVIVITRGGGSAEDLAAFSHEQVTRAVATSRIPTVVAIGHEIDVSLAELAADQRASTPSNAAELLTPDRAVVLRRLEEMRAGLNDGLLGVVARRKDWVAQQRLEINRELRASFEAAQMHLRAARQLLEAYDPLAAMRRGYAVVRAGGKTIKSIVGLSDGDEVELQLSDGIAKATITNTEKLQ